MRLATLATWAPTSLGPSWDLKSWACLCLTVQPGYPMKKVLPFVSIVVFPCPGLHPPPDTSALPNPGSIPPPVSMAPGQPPPQQLLAPTYFSAPGRSWTLVTPVTLYAPGALAPPPPHLYPNTQVRWLDEIFPKYTSFKSDKNIGWGEYSEF